MVEPAQMVAYALFSGAELIYVGVASNPSLRIREHELEGREFTRFEVLSKPVEPEQAREIERQLLGDFARNHNGQLPRYNERVA